MFSVDPCVAELYMQSVRRGVDTRAQTLEVAISSDLDVMPSPDRRPFVIIVMGVSGCGKSTLGTALAAAMREQGDGKGFPFVDGDDLHSQSNVSKMAAGMPLTDADRAPWLRRIREHAQRVAGQEAQRPCSSDDTSSDAIGWRGIVVACSALKRKYRDYLRFGEGQDDDGVGGEAASEGIAIPVRTLFVFVDGSEEALVGRVEKREGHFMKKGMLGSQMATLEDPRGEEGVVAVGLEMTTEEQVRHALEGLRMWMDRWEHQSGPSG